MAEVKIKLYSMTVPGIGTSVSTSTHVFFKVLEGTAPGRYRIDAHVERPELLASVARPWGWATKHEDGRVDIEPMGDTG